MALDLSIPKEFNSGTRVSCTIVSEGGEPAATVSVDGQSLESNVLWLSEAKYKLNFVLPSGSSGKEGEISVSGGGETASQEFKIA